ncbi:MAG: multidrug efflux SMR transporter [Pirellulaceae bacterium]|nr:multidrug efflux SMR transporter [Pirellulaceae bacterium]
MAWVYLITASMLEIVWAISLKYTDGFTRLWPSVLTVVAMLASFGCLSVAMRSIPVGSCYAMWTGTGAVGTALLGMAFLGEPFSAARIVCVLLIAVGVVGMKILSP